MSTHAPAAVRPRDRLPAMELPRAGAAAPEASVALRVPRLGSLVLFLVHDPACTSCRAYMDELRALDRACRVWGARRIVVLPAPPEAVGRDPAADETYVVAADAEARLARALGVAGEPTLVIADRFGECFEVHRADRDHAGLPSGEEIEAWLRFLGTQCPECGVPDEAWR